MIFVRFFLVRLRIVFEDVEYWVLFIWVGFKFSW